MISSSYLVTNLVNFLIFLFLIICGLIIFYNLFFCITLLNIWFVNLFNLEDFFHNILDMGRFPVQIYKGFAAQVFTFIVPIGYIATFPVQALLGKLEVTSFIIAIFLVLITSVFSHWFWNFALKRYSSASSVSSKTNPNSTMFGYD